MTHLPPLGERLYRLLLSLYPKWFVERHGTRMVEAFREQRSEACYDGAKGRLRFGWDIGSDLVINLMRVRRRYSDTADTVTAMSNDGSKTVEVVVDGMIQDLRFAFRTLGRAPMFTLVAVLTLAIGIGSTAAIFGVVNGVLLRPLPYGQPEEVVTIWSQWIGFPKTWVSEAEYRNYLDQNQSLEDIAIWYHTTVNFTNVDNPERVSGVGASENLMEVLDVPMAAGRFFTRDEAFRADTLPAEVIVLSHEGWTRRYGRDPSIVGSSVEINGRLRTVIGVTPAGFRIPTHFGVDAVADVYFPYYLERTPVSNFPVGGGSHGRYMAGRLRDGLTVEDARRDINRVVDLRRAAGSYPAAQQFNALVSSAQDDILGAIRPALIALFGAVGFVLLIACANVANLMLARSQGRRSELAVRAALGAGRGRLVRQMLTESLVLSALGGVLGIAVALAGMQAFQALDPGNLPRIGEVSIDGTVLLFSIAMTGVTALLFGALPAIKIARGNLKPSMASRGSAGGVAREGWQGTLVALEMALAVVLVIGAGLMVQTFASLVSIDPGFDGDNVLTMAVSLPAASYPTSSEVNGFFREATRRIGEIPGVQIATATRIIPLGSQIGDWGLAVEGYQPSDGENVNGDWQIAAPGYFEAMDIPVIQGRTFNPSDDEEGAPVAIVNEALVRKYFGAQDPIGRHIFMGGDPNRGFTVVGVVGDVRHNGLTADIKRKFYIPHAQWEYGTGSPRRSMSFVVRAAASPEQLAQPIRSVIREMDPSLSIADVRTVEDVVSAAVAQPRFTVVLMGAFSLVAVLLALVGIYGVISYGVSQRTREIGLRMALGAEQDSVVALMVKRGLGMTMVGLAVGLVAAYGLTRFLSSLLYGVSPQDLMTFVTVGIGFAFVALAATYIPSRRAARVDPMRALSSD